MEIVVNDTNILIDLYNSGLLPYCKRLNLEFRTLDVVMNEIEVPDQQKAIQSIIDDGTLTYKIPCSGVISRPAASTSCRSFFITSAGIHLRSTLTVRTRLRLRTMSIGA